jgi:hypothetical protein
MTTTKANLPATTGEISPWAFWPPVILANLAASFAFVQFWGFVSGHGSPLILMALIAFQLFLGTTLDVFDNRLARRGQWRYGRTVHLTKSTFPLHFDPLQSTETRVELWSTRWFIPICLTLVSFVGFVIFYQHGSQTPYPAGGLIIPFLLLVIALFLLGRGLVGRPRAWADADGITGYHRGFLPLTRKFVPWMKLDTCVVEAKTNRFGKLYLSTPTLRDPAGKRLIKLNLAGTSSIDQQRLIDMIQSKLPLKTGITISKDGMR